jgi:Peptidase family C25
MFRIQSNREYGRIGLILIILTVSFIYPFAAAGFEQALSLEEDFQVLVNDPGCRIVLSFESHPDRPALPAISKLIDISMSHAVSGHIEAVETDRIPTCNFAHFDRELFSSRNAFLDRVPQLETVDSVTFPLHFDEPEIFRSLRVVRMTVHPLLYDDVADELIVLRKGRIHIEMRADPSGTVHPSLPPITPSFDMLYSAVVLNYVPKQRDEFGDPESYLIVTPDEYEARLQGFLAWKAEEGYRIDIIRTSELPLYPAPADLKQAIQTYYNGSDPPVYVLICGDQYTTPLFYSYDVTYPGDYVDDLYYSLLSGDDLIPDVFLGRLPAKTGEELTIMLSKILEYELSPQTSNPDFYSTALMAASALEESQVTTKEQTRERLETYCGYETVHTYYEWSDEQIDNLMIDINQGVSIINYRGEGWRRGWNPLHEYWFDFDDVYTLHNAHLTPFITSIGCGVCMFESLDECWGHAMMAHGSVTTPMGSVGIIGPTWNTHTTYNNWIDRGIYRGYVYWDVYRSTPMMDYGKLYMADYFPEPEHEDFIDVHFRTYLNFGTPDMWVRTGYPLETITGLAFANNAMDRYVVARDGLGNIVDAATISWSANHIRKVYPADEYGGAPIDLESVENNQVRVVIAGKNLIPVDTLLPWIPTGSTGSVIITEIKPDVLTEAENGDTVELCNLNGSPVDLNGWILSDLDGYDTPFVDMEAVLQPMQLAVVVFAGPQYEEQIIPMPYGLKIISREIPDFSSLEDVAVLRDPLGAVTDCVAWHDLSGTGSTNVAGDLSRMTPPTSPFDINDGGWWDGPDTVNQSNYEQYSVDWSPFAGNGGDGTIQRSWTGSPDGKGNFTVQSQTGFGLYQHSESKRMKIDLQ